jgi:cbb3-type cytochrome oxidase subunit 3
MQDEFETESLKSKAGKFIKRQTKNLFDEFIKSDIVPPPACNIDDVRDNSSNTPGQRVVLFFKRQLSNILAHTRAGLVKFIKSLLMFLFSFIFLAVIVIIVFKTPAGDRLTGYFAKDMPPDYVHISFIGAIFAIILMWFTIVYLVRFINHTLGNDLKKYNDRKNKRKEP